MNSDDCEIIYIPDKPPFSAHQQPTVNVLASFIEPKFAHILVRKLNKVAPLESLRHVKRIRKEYIEGGNTRLSIILCLAGDGESETHDHACVPQDVNELISLYQMNGFVAKVCKHAAASKEEWEEQCKLWPSSFHPPTYNIEGISGFSEEGSKSVFNYMNSAIKLAASRKEIVNAALIVNPSSDQVISTACDELYSWQVSNGGRKETENHYSSHSENYFPPLGNCSSNVKELQSNVSLDEAKSCSYPAVMCLNPWQWSQRQLPSSSCYFHPLRHAAMVVIADSADRDRCLFPDRNQKDGEPFQVDPSEEAAGSPAKRMKITPHNVLHGEEVTPVDSTHSNSARPYLCTGFDIYLVWEPCPMCAMALVHQRIRRIFYAFPNPNTGALGSIHRLQGEKSLNHHYAVFQVKLPNSVLGVHNESAAEESDLKEA